jgi:hypothetical protein
MQARDCALYVKRTHALTHTLAVHTLQTASNSHKNGTKKVITMFSFTYFKDVTADQLSPQHNHVGTDDSFSQVTKIDLPTQCSFQTQCVSFKFKFTSPATIRYYHTVIGTPFLVRGPLCSA